MSIPQLTPEQIQTMTLEEKDQWWLKNVFKGNAPQLNLRSALTGMLLGGVLSLTNLYVGIKTGWTLGVGVTSVILSFAIFKLFSKLGIGKEMTVLENNAMQSIATSAGYMTAPMMASLPAYMMVTGNVIPMWQTYWWICALSVLGVLFAFPLKKRFINDEQLPFPEGYAAGIVLDSLHQDTGKEGLFKAKLLMGGAGLAALIETLRSEKVTQALKIPFLQLPEYWDDFIYKFATPAIMGTPLKDLTIRLDTSIVLMGTGGLMSMKTAMSLLLGALFNYLFLAPILINQGIITGPGFKAITMWALWGGTAIMTTSSLYSFFSKPQVIISAFTRLMKKSIQSEQSHQLDKIELPMWVFVVGIPLVGAVTVWMGHVWFGVEYWLGIIAVPLVFIFTLIAVNATGLTAITPGGALGKLTQITYSVLAPGNIPTNLMTAGITSEVSLNASNLLMDIKPGYMLGGKPRHQAVGHVLGIFAGGLVAVPVFYALFNNDITKFTSEQMPLPGAAIWKAVAEVLTKGLSTLHPTAQLAVLIGAILGIVIEVLNQKSKGKFPISGVGLGLAFVLRFTDSLMMALGALFFWFMSKKIKDEKSFSFRAFVQNQETVAAGVIAGGSIVGLLILIFETLL
ncbi:MAG TPA: OPT family oligopeptide transporter [Pseudobdellovibrionaceae bacterium]|nr:OPT family oligopeptide transporter [Pseudobdellovibrionaceae bacterium]